MFGKFTRRQFLSSTSQLIASSFLFSSIKNKKNKKFQVFSKETPVAVVKNPSVIGYSHINFPFDPPFKYPEYPYAIEIFNPSNDIYPMVREVLRLLRPDNFGTPDWNPFGNIIDKNHTKILIKPNLFSPNCFANITVIRPLIDYAYIALRKAGVSGKIMIGDAPGIDGEFNTIDSLIGLTELQNRMREYGVTIEIKDMTKDTYTSIDMLSLGMSEFGENAVKSPPKNAIYYGPGSPGYFIGDKIRPYMVADTVLDADVIINVPKMKIHTLRALVTLCLKNFIGIQRNNPEHLDMGVPSYKECAHYSDLEEAAGDPGVQYNDTIWRAILDLNKIVFYYKNGFKQERQRNYFGMIDGIIGFSGMGNKIHSTIIGGYDPVAIDSVASRTMGVNHLVVPQIYYGGQIKNYYLGTNDASKIEVLMPNNETISEKYPANDYFEPKMTSPLGNSELPDTNGPLLSEVTYNNNVITAKVRDDSEIKKAEVYYTLFSGKNGKISLQLTDGNTKNGVFTGVLVEGTEKFYIKVTDMYFNDTYSIIYHDISIKEVMKETKVFQSYPNPFNPECYIPYELKDNGDVKVRIYNVLGQKVRKLDLGQKQVGSYITKDKAAYWDGKDSKGKEVISGVYYYELVVDDKVVGIKKSLVLK